MRQKGESYSTVVTVIKAKNGKVTKLFVDGEEYSLVHKDTANGHKSKVKK